METKPTDWRLIALLWVTGLLAASQFAKLTLTLDAVQAAYPAGSAPMALSCVAVVGVLFGSVSGFLVARIGARRAILFGAGLSACVALGQGVAMPFTAFIGTRVVEGVGHLLLVVALPTMIASVARPKDKSVVMGLWGAFFGVSYALCALVVPVIEGWGGFRAVYVAQGALLAGLWPLLYWATPRIMTAGAKMPPVWALHRQIYTTPRFLAPAVGHGIYASLFIALVAYLPGALGAMWLTPLLPVANLMGTLASGFVAKRLPASRLSPLGFALAGGLFALIGMTGSPMLAVLAFVATGLSAGANFAAVPELNADPEDQARANGAMAQLGNIGTFSGTPLFALVAGSLWGVTGLSLAVCMSGMILGGAVYAHARRHG